MLLKFLNNGASPATPQGTAGAPRTDFRPWWRGGLDPSKRKGRWLQTNQPVKLDK